MSTQEKKDLKRICLALGNSLDIHRSLCSMYHSMLQFIRSLPQKDHTKPCVTAVTQGLVWSFCGSDRIKCTCLFILQDQHVWAYHPTNNYHMKCKDCSRKSIFPCFFFFGLYSEPKEGKRAPPGCDCGSFFCWRLVCKFVLESSKQTHLLSRFYL
jgi:hypothetical protein